jgi:hypothetical protein
VEEGQIYFKGGTILPRWSQLIGEIGGEFQGCSAALWGTKAAVLILEVFDSV